MSNKPTIVVTGGAGFIGSHFVNYIFKKTRSDIVVVDNMTYAADITRISQEVWDSERFKFIEEDICNLKEKDLPAFTYMVNFAAESHVDNSIKNGKPFVRTNVEGTLNLLDIVKAKNNPKFKKFVQISTDEVYGDMADYRPHADADEAFPIKPSSYYSAAKASADLLVQAASRTYGIPFLITRSCNNFGTGQHPEKFLPKIFKSINSGKKVPVYGDGKQTREWIHVTDNVQIIYTLMSLSTKDLVVNIGSGYHFKNIEVIKIIGKLMNKSVKTVNVKDRLGHDRKYSLNCKYLIDSKIGDYVFLTLEGFLKDEIKKLTNSTNRR